MTYYSKIAIIGSAGLIGSYLMENLKPNSVLVPVDRKTSYDQLAFKFVDEEVDTVIWAAANRAWPQDDALEQAQDIYYFAELIRAAELTGIKRIIFSSSFMVDWEDYGLQGEHYGRNIGWKNYYRAMKVACEEMLEAWAGKTGQSGVSIRLGWYAPGYQKLPPNGYDKIRMSDDNLRLNYLTAIEMNVPSGSCAVLHSVSEAKNYTKIYVQAAFCNGGEYLSAPYPRKRAAHD